MNKLYDTIQGSVNYTNAFLSWLHFEGHLTPVWWKNSHINQIVDTNISK